MNRVRIEVRVPSGSPPEAVFAAMVDLPSQERWIPATRLYALDGDVRAPEVGSRIAGFTNLFGIGFLDTMTVTEYVPDRSWTTIHTGDFVRGEGIFAVEPDGEGCVAIWVEDVDVPFGAVGRLGFSLVKPVVAGALRFSLRRLVRGVQRGTLPVRTGAPK